MEAPRNKAIGTVTVNLVILIHRAQQQARTEKHRNDTIIGLSSKIRNKGTEKLLDQYALR